MTSSDPIPGGTGTTFAETEGAVSYYVTPMKETLTSDLTDAVDSGYHQTIVHFLQKPYPIRTGTISTATPVGDIAASEIEIFGDISALTLYTEKLKGFLGFKATTIIRLQTNATRFMQGRLLMHFVPQAASHQDDVYGIRNVNLTTISQHPRVELDIATQSEAIFEIPYISPANCLNLQTGVGNVGSVWLTVYSPLEVGASAPTEFTYTMWISFKDIEISTPSTPNLVFGTQMNEARDMGNDIGKRILKAIPPGSLKAKMVADAENRKSAWLSTTLGNMADLSSNIASLALPVAPTLSALAGPTSWALSAAAGLASAFGWSKKTILNEPTIVRFGTSPYMNNSDGNDTSIVLANQSTNEVRVLPGFANTNMDEMSLKSLVQRPAYLTSVTWSVGTAADNFIFVDLVKPAYYYLDRTEQSYAGATVTANTRSYLPISYFSRFFRYYRGSVKYTIKFVKTEFHSGRVLISYTPGNSLSAPDNAASSYVFRDILDIRHSSEFSFICPYVATTPYRPTVNTTADLGQLASMGYFQIRILNELQAPETVSQSVNIIIEVSACDDFELACPVPFIGGDEPNVNCNIFRTQMDSSSEIVGAISKPIGSSSIVGSGNLAPAEFCIGETITSIKQLLSRFSRVTTKNANASLQNRTWYPYYMGFAGFDSLGALVTPGMASDWFSRFGACFAYGRGSVRFGVAATTSTTLPTWVTMYTVFDDSVTTASDVSAAGGGSRYMRQHATVNFAQMNNFAELKIPMYAHTPFQNNLFGAVLTPSTTYTPFHNRFGIESTTNNPAYTCDTYRAVGDDFQFGFFLNCPLVLVNTV